MQKPERARFLLKEIALLAGDKPLRIMNVCGGHERTIAMSGLRDLLPESLQLVAGPGCPVCVCPQEDIALAIDWALSMPVTILCFGDMLKVPVHTSSSKVKSFADARAHGADIRVIATPQEAFSAARRQPDREFIFHVVGFETTMAPVAAAMADGLPDNLFLLVSGRLTSPAVVMMLNRSPGSFDGLIAPGHVATIMGSEEWDDFPRHHGLPVAVSGFTPEGLLLAIHAILLQIARGEVENSNCYSVAVGRTGNASARRLLAEYFDVVDALWRGIGMIPDSGYRLKTLWEGHDALARRPETAMLYSRSGDMPPGCACSSVIMGEIEPSACPLYARGCKPFSPVGPCMVSDEGACRIAFDSGIRAA